MQVEQRNNSPMTTKKELHIVYTNIKSKENTLCFYESLDMKKRDKSLTCDNDEVKGQMINPHHSR
jgi:hypothetical protein